ncbi:MAG TPA: EAL domain-containing protein [Acetobacteraceae bacterium]|nr:EAL domain-containing protein [Acetobacteraceae bacterium]
MHPPMATQAHAEQGGVRQRRQGRARRRFRLPLGLGLAAMTLAGAITGAAALVAWDGRERRIAEESQELQNLAMVLADHTERAFQSVEIVQASLIDRMRSDGVRDADGLRAWAATPFVHHLLRDRIAGLPQADAVLVIDRDGRLLAYSRAWPAPPNELGDRAYFKAVQTGAERYVGPPVQNRGTGTWTIHLAQRVSGPEGEFLGAVVGVVELDWFERFYAGLHLDNGSHISLYREDAVLLARHPRSTATIGRQLPDTSNFEALGRQGGAVMRFTSQIDGRQRLTGARLLAAYPLRVHVGTTADDVLAEWREQTRWLAGGTALLVLMIAGAAVVAFRLMRARAAAEAARDGAAEQSRRAAEAAREAMEARLSLAEARLGHERDMAAQHAEFRIAVEGMSQGLWKFGADGRLAISNYRCAELLGLPHEVLRQGATFAELAEASARVGGGAAAVVARLAFLMKRGEPDSFVCDLGEGRAAGVGFQPLMDGGWIATFEDVTERRAAQRRVEHMARHDALTGLPNRTMFHERLTAALSDTARSGEPIAVLYLDLDNFKAVNDTLGHPVGDALLQAATARIGNLLREGDMAARLGGDEFAIVLSPGSPQPAAASALAERLIAALSEHFTVDGHQVIVGTSVGVAVAPQDGRDADTLLKNADLALYRAKHDGRGRCRFFEPGMDARVQARRLLEMDLRRALSTTEFEVHYQPIVEVASRRITGFEALVRWRHPERGLVSPAEFIPLAEEIGLIVQLGEIVLRRACREAAAWPAPVRVAVNLSPAQFRSPRLVDMVREALSDSTLDPRRLELEITEGVLLTKTEATLGTLHQLRDFGVRIAMDDFGTGYSSLSYLRSFPFDKVKIDRAFVRDLETRRDDAAIVQAVTRMCAQLGMTTTAEGVETEQQFRQLRDLACVEAQGFLFSRPQPAAEVPALLARYGSACAAPGPKLAAE